VRNSSLVQWSCADNVAGLKHTAEAVSLTHRPCPLSRGGTEGCGRVGERPVSGEAAL